MSVVEARNQNQTENPEVDQETLNTMLFDRIMAARIARQALVTRQSKGVVSEEVQELLESSDHIVGYTKFPEKMPRFSGSLLSIVRDGMQAYSQLLNTLAAETNEAIVAEYGPNADEFQTDIQNAAKKTLSTFRPNPEVKITDIFRSEFDQVSKVTRETIAKRGVEPALEANLGIVYSIANRIGIDYAGAGLEFDDIVSIGRMALLEALQRYDQSKGAFSTYASTIVRGRIIDEVRRSSFGSRVNYSRRKEINRFIDNFEANHGRPPSNTEIAEALSLTSEQIDNTMNSTTKLIQLESEQWNLVDEGRVKNALNIGSQSPEEMLVDLEDQQELADMFNRFKMIISNIGSRYGEIVRLYYEEDFTMSEIAAAMGISESRVTQLHKEAIEIAREAFENGSIRKPKYPNNKRKELPSQLMTEIAARIYRGEVKLGLTDFYIGKNEREVKKLKELVAVLGEGITIKDLIILINVGSREFNPILKKVAQLTKGEQEAVFDALGLRGNIPKVSGRLDNIIKKLQAL